MIVSTFAEALAKRKMKRSELLKIANEKYKLTRGAIDSLYNKDLKKIDARILDIVCEILEADVSEIIVRKPNSSSTPS